MKKAFLAISLLVPVVFLGACVGENDSVVQLDGPILETEGVDGRLEFNGAVVNTDNFPVQSVYVVISIEDSEGGTIAISSVLVDEGAELYPEESAFFTVSFENLPADAASKEVEIYYDLVEE